MTIYFSKNATWQIINRHRIHDQCQVGTRRLGPIDSNNGRAGENNQLRVETSSKVAGESICADGGVFAFVRLVNFCCLTNLAIFFGWY